MANWNKLTENKFKAIKMLLSGGAIYAEAAEYMQVSENTVYWVSKSETFEEYENNRAERELRRAKARAAKMAAEQKAQEAKKAADAVGAVKASQIVKQAEAPAEIVKEIRQSVTVQATHYMETKLDKAIELLTGISAKLAVIIEDLYGVKTCGADETKAE